MNYNFIEIGTSDFRTLADRMRGPGISVEPIRKYLYRLPEKEDCFKVTAAISNYNGFIDVHYLTEEKINELGLPNWAKGCNSVNGPHKTIQKLLGSAYWDHITIQSATVITLEALFDIFNVESVFKFQIDTEGHDAVILWQYIEMAQSNPDILADILVFENNELSDSAEMVSVQNALSKWYSMKERKGNIICRKL
jgi:hypothetical protein